MERVEVERVTDTQFRVRVIDGRSESAHDVTVNPENYTLFDLYRQSRKDSPEARTAFLGAVRT